ncbi:MAG: hypothetical protein AAFQ67_07755, partial [Pseudomonadota bacterium]
KTLDSPRELLQRHVSLEEFTGRIQRLADEVREDGSEDVLVENLTTDAPIKPDADGIERPSSPPTPPIRRRRAS